MPQDTSRTDKRLQRQRMFQQEYRDDTPRWYRGEMHLAFTLFVTFGTIWFCAAHIQAPTFWEWMLFVPMAFIGNWVEWAAHRYVLHRPVPGLKMVYKRHCATHHQFFTDADLTYKGHKDWRALLFPPFAPIAFILVAIPPAVILAALWSANAGYFIVAQMAGYYLMYEGLHTLSHLDDAKHPYLARIPLINSMRRMHKAHHDLTLMQTSNFNLTFPLCDALFGTSDIDRGVLGTLFSGANEPSENETDSARKVEPPAEFYGELDDYYREADTA